MIKNLAICAVMLFTFSAVAQDVTFNCTDIATKRSVVLVVNTVEADLGGEVLLRDVNYMGYNAKRFHRFVNESKELLVPTMMTHDKTNEGMAFLFTYAGSIELSCSK